MSPSLRRKLFYAFWAALIVSVVYVGREVMLPFVLALVVAYVLTPAVAWVEKKKVPRAGAIVLV
ncbi:MAG: AI-2E family transporter, partial [Polyangiaceae bacterium]|nr:AI-2E family transporter [Polyangiaceae bacterium]